LHYIPAIQKCYQSYAKYLQDDFSCSEEDIFEFIGRISPFCWAIIARKTNQFMGFVYLDNLIGGSVKVSSETNESGNPLLYSAELTTCFDKQAWGDFTRYSAKIFLKKCFDELGLYKIKAQIYPDNFRIKTLLKFAGFEYEATLKAETLRAGKPQDIDVYALYRDYYYKKR